MSNEIMSNQDIQYDKEKIELIKRMYCKDATDEELGLFMHVCKKSGLDPMLKQVYAIKRYDSSTKTMKLSIQTSIDGYRLIAERTGRYSPGREPTFCYNKEGGIFSATAYIKKMTADGTWHEVGATAFFNEYCQKTKEGNPTQFWLKMGHVMISKCAEALALRKAFPDYLSGIYTDDEMRQADKIEEVQSEIIEPKKIEVPLISNEDRDAQIKTIKDILKDCGDEYEEKIIQHYKILSIDGLPDDQIAMVLKRACAFREIKMKRDESQG